LSRIVPDYLGNLHKGDGLGKREKLRSASGTREWRRDPDEP
jgi:hypothetical protein